MTVYFEHSAADSHQAEIGRLSLRNHQGEKKNLIILESFLNPCSFSPWVSKHVKLPVVTECSPALVSVRSLWLLFILRGHLPRASLRYLRLRPRPTGLCRRAGSRRQQRAAGPARLLGARPGCTGARLLEVRPGCSRSGPAVPGPARLLKARPGCCGASRENWLAGNVGNCSPSATQMACLPKWLWCGRMFSLSP